MKRLLALLLAIVLCFVLSGAPVHSDPGDETPPDSDTTGVVVENTDYPPPPPGYVGIWPPPEMVASTDSAAPYTGDDATWDDPYE